MLPNVGTIGYHGKDSHGKELPVPIMARNCRFPDLEIHGSQSGNQRLPLQGIAGSQKLESMFSKLSGYYYKELRVPKA